MDEVDELIDVATMDDNGTNLLAHVTKQKAFVKPSANANIPSSDIRKVLSTNKTDSTGSKGGKPLPSEFNVNGKLYRLVNAARIVYRVTASTNQGASLIDRGANGGIAGDDVRIISKTYVMLISKVLTNTN